MLEEFNCPRYVIEHSKAVMLKAADLSLNFKGKVDLNLVKAGAMLHDVGRSKTAGIKHAVVGADILRKNHFPQEIVKIVERHIGSGISKKEAEILGLPPQDYIPVTLEEKLVAHADNLIHGTGEVDLDFVIKKWTDKMGAHHPSIIRLERLHAELVDAFD
ncbi:MAG: TIGR00295 family protein [Methanobacteriaceae archaeon]|nr:TIGR00295 family protein [Methanobacteriaceae archaeon]